MVCTGVDYVFSSKSEALYAQRLFHPYGAVIPIGLDEMPQHPRGQKPYRVMINQNGNAPFVERITRDYDFVRATKEEWVATDWTAGRGSKLQASWNTLIRFVGQNAE